MSGLNRPWDSPPDPLVALRDGDPEPFEAFVRASAARFVGFFRRQGAGPEEAEDLTQEVFLKLHQNAARYRQEERFSSFCFRVARNVWIDGQRRRAARPRPLSLDKRLGGPQGAQADRAGVLGDTLAGEAPEPFEALRVREEAERLRSAARELPEHHRLVFELGVVQELSYGEISSILDIPTGTVKSRMFHAVRRLREVLEGNPSAAGTDERGSAPPNTPPQGGAR
ncbi:MAG: RNA polymerase sigma factor [Planctomycetota bacterium]